MLKIRMVGVQQLLYLPRLFNPLKKDLVRGAGHDPGLIPPTRDVRAQQGQTQALVRTQRMALLGIDVVRRGGVLQALVLQLRRYFCNPPQMEV